MGAITIRINKSTLVVDVDAFEVGTHSSCTLHLRDPVASAHHARITRAGSKFQVEDLGTATGTWRNGVEVDTATQLVDGDVLVVGCSKIVVTLDPAGAALQLEVLEQGFYFEPSRAHKSESGAMQVGGDAERWVRDEVSFGRSPALFFAGCVALLVTAVCLGALALPSGREKLLQPGPLSGAHALLFDDNAGAGLSPRLQDCARLAQEQGCSACHDTFGGTPPERCGTCHADLIAQNHPFHGDRSTSASTAEIMLDGDVCASCHMDHSGAAPADGTFLPTPEALRDSCARCHSNGTPAITRRPTQFESVPHELAYDRFPHDKHADQRCDICHQRDTSEANALSDRDFARVEFKRCMDCHSADAAPTAANGWGRDPALADIAATLKPEQQVRLLWHGAEAEDGSSSRCLDCHAALHQAALREVTVEEAEELVFTIQRRTHADLFAGAESVSDSTGRDRTCLECHASGSPHAGETLDRRFWHELHMTGVRPDDPASAVALSAGCAECHVDIESATTLAGAPNAARSYTGPPLVACGECHWDEVGGAQKPLALEAKQQGASESRRRVDFPHAVHVKPRTDSSDTSALDEGCFACHTFAAGERSFESEVETHPDAKSCRACHTDHAHVGGDSPMGCALCHPDAADGSPDPVWLGKPSIRMRPDTPGFSHWSRGHASITDGSDCAQCHAGVEKARTIAEVPIPSEAESACFDCHVQERFHWRGAPTKAVVVAPK